mgnify:CR=1 FL=1
MRNLCFNIVMTPTFDGLDNVIYMYYHGISYTKIPHNWGCLLSEAQWSTFPATHLSQIRVYQGDWTKRMGKHCAFTEKALELGAWCLIIETFLYLSTWGDWLYRPVPYRWGSAFHQFFYAIFNQRYTSIQLSVTFATQCKGYIFCIKARPKYIHNDTYVCVKQCYI